MTLSRSNPRKKQRWGVLLALVTAMTLVIGSVALADHGSATLSSSNFEIDNDANLKVDDSGKDDWANQAHTGTNPPERRAIDVATGQNDNSYKGGVKEDTACPGETTGSIPNNKSDLKTFSVYVEDGVGTHPGYVHLAWSRVSDPSGTTLMDFEFNQSSTTCTSGPNKERTAGDLLIEYSIDQGGARATVTKRTWTGSAWGAAQDMSVPNPLCGNMPCAAGTINTSPIPAAESDGLIDSGQLSARTFGEASIDLRTIFQSGSCTSFGSAMLKSRSSTSFTSQLKDFISPIGIQLTNCGTVIIRKDTGGVTSPDFNFTKSFNTDPATANAFALAGGGTRPFTGVLFGSGYTVVENTPLPTGWAFDRIDCSVAGRASVGVTPTINNTTRTVTFAIDDESDVLDCTFYNLRPKADPTASTIPTLVPQDSATISGLDTTGLVEGSADKVMTFTLHDPADTTCTGTPLFSQPVTVTANQEYKTTNSGTSPNGYTINATGTYRWKVVYNGDSRNNGFTIDCGEERVTVTELRSHPAP